MADDDGGVFSWLPDEFLDDTLFASMEPTTEAESTDEDGDEEPKVLPGSPQSTLCPVEGWSTPLGQSHRFAAGRAMKDKRSRFQGRGILATPNFLQLERLRREELIKQQISVAGANIEVAAAARLPLQQRHQRRPQPGSGMRAVFLNAARSGKSSNGTGVFIPRSAGNTSETRRKPACSTVLIPARVARALNLNLDELNADSRAARFPGRFIMDNDADVARGNLELPFSQKQSHLRQEPPATSICP